MTNRRSSPVLLLILAAVFGGDLSGSCHETASAADVNGVCGAKNSEDSCLVEEETCPSDEVIHLKDLEEDFWKEKKQKMFFIESSDRPTLNPRQICSVESAIRNAGNFI